MITMKFIVWTKNKKRQNKKHPFYRYNVTKIPNDDDDMEFNWWKSTFHFNESVVAFFKNCKIVKYNKIKFIVLNFFLTPFFFFFCL
jgi:hypothetical protein